MLGLGFLDGAGLVQVVEGGDLGADEALGEVGVDLAGGRGRWAPRSRFQPRTSGSPAVKNVMMPTAS